MHSRLTVTSHQTNKQKKPKQKTTNHDWPIKLDGHCWSLKTIICIRQFSFNIFEISTMTGKTETDTLDKQSLWEGHTWIYLCFYILHHKKKLYVNFSQYIRTLHFSPRNTTHSTKHYKNLSFKRYRQIFLFEQKIEHCMYFHVHIEADTYTPKPCIASTLHHPLTLRKHYSESPPLLCGQKQIMQSSYISSTLTSSQHILTGFTLFFFFFFFFAFPSYISGVHHFWVRFLRMWPFFNPTIKVVTFRLRGWCVLGVFLLPAFNRLGHERQDLLSPCDEMHVCTD